MLLAEEPVTAGARLSSTDGSLVCSCIFQHRTYLELDISFSGEDAERCTQRAIVVFLSALNGLKGLFFVKSLFESLKVSQLALV